MKKMFVIIAVTTLLLQAGCGSMQVEHEELDPHFGSSVRQAVRQQIYNPEAGGDAPVVGLDGRYAEKVADKHYEGPKTKPEAGQSVSEIVISGN